MPGRILPLAAPLAAMALCLGAPARAQQPAATACVPTSVEEICVDDDGDPATPAVRVRLPGARAEAPPPRWAMREGRPRLTLFDGGLTVEPVLRLDLDMGGYFAQPLAPGGAPPKLLDDTRPGVPAEGLNFRRARVGLQGTLLRDLTWNVTWDFAQAPGTGFDPVKYSRLFEAQLAYTALPWVTPRVGAFTLMSGIPYAMSSFERTFLEPPAIVIVATSLAAGDSRIAAGAESRGERWSAAFYATAGTTTTLDDGRQRGLVARVTGMAVDQDWLKLSLGVNASTQLEPGTRGAPDTFRLRDYPELRLDPTRLLDTGSLGARQGWALGPELQALAGPVYVQAEAYAIRLDATAEGGERRFRGYYIDASLPLLGPPRRYDSRRAVFTRPRVAEADPRAGEWGWLELAARWSWVSLNDGPVRGGSQGILGLALNWYPTARLRATLQYQLGDIRLQPGTVNSPTGADRAFQSLGGRLAFNW